MEFSRHHILAASGVTAWRLDPRYAPLLISVIMAIAMSLVMSLVQTIVRLGFTPGLMHAWFHSFATSLMIAVPTSQLIGPFAQRLVNHLTGAAHK